MAARLRLILLVATATFGAAASAAVARTERLSCGEVVTHDVRLAADVTCSEMSGLIIGADHITIDLGGHSVAVYRGVGVVDTGHRDVTIRNGAISAVSLTGAIDNRLVNLAIGADRYSGVHIEGGSSNLVKSSVIGDASPIYVWGSDAVRFVGNTITNSVAGGIYVFSDRGAIVDNKITTFFAGIAVLGSSNSIARNSVTGGIEVSGSSNKIARNDVSLGSYGVNIRIDSGDRNLVWGNQTFNGPNGLLVDAAATNTAVIHNTATGNSNDGIDLQSPSTLLVGNHADNNGNYGINAVPGVSAFGNHATGNGNPTQCLNVRCT